MDIRVINKFYNNLIEINSTQHAKLNKIKNNTLRPIDSMFLNSTYNLEISIKNILKALNKNNDSSIELTLKDLIRNMTKLLNDDMSNIIKQLFDYKKARSLNSQLKKKREYYIDIIENKLKHEQNNINIFKKIGEKSILYGFFVDKISQDKIKKIARYNKKPDPTIHKKFEGVHTGFSINRYINHCIYIIVSTINILNIEIENSFSINNKNNKTLSIVNTINKINLEKSYFIDEYKNATLYNIENFFITIDKNSTYQKMYRLEISFFLEKGVEYSIPYLKNDKSFLL